MERRFMTGYGFLWNWATKHISPEFTNESFLLAPFIIQKFVSMAQPLRFDWSSSSRCMNANSAPNYGIFWTGSCWFVRTAKKGSLLMSLFDRHLRMKIGDCPVEANRNCSLFQLFIGSYANLNFSNCPTREVLIISCAVFSLLPVKVSQSACFGISLPKLITAGPQN